MVRKYKEELSSFLFTKLRDVDVVEFGGFLENQLSTPRNTR